MSPNWKDSEKGIITELQQGNKDKAIAIALEYLKEKQTNSYLENYLHPSTLIDIISCRIRKAVTLNIGRSDLQQDGIGNFLIEQIWHCSNLEELIFEGYISMWNFSSYSEVDFNRFREIPEGIQQLKDLKKLTLIGRAVENGAMGSSVENIYGLGHLGNLEYINLAGNKVQDITSILNCKKLKYLNLAVNQVKDFELIRQISQMPCLEVLILAGNPISGIPETVIGKYDYWSKKGKNCLQDLRVYFNSLKVGWQYNNRFKLILAGNGLVGKTSIANRFINDSYSSPKDRTHGITINSYFELENEIQIWDLGGQEIYHSTHRLFLRTKGIYLLVWTNQNEIQNLNTINYWADLISSNKGDCLIIITQNKIDKDGTIPIELSKIDLQKKLIFLPLLNVSAKTGKNFEFLKQSISSIILHLKEQRHDKLPISWILLLEKIGELKSSNVKEISVKSFLEICLTLGIQENETDLLLALLTDIGEIYFHKERFGNRIFIDQNWIIHLLYRLFDPKEKNFWIAKSKNGVIDMNDAVEIWSDLSIIDIQTIFAFFLNCDLCFRINNSSDDFLTQRFVFPQFLPEQDKTILKEKLIQSDIKVHMSLNYLHRGEMDSVLCSFGYHHSNKLWKNAAYIESNSCKYYLEFDERKASVSLHLEKGKGNVVKAIFYLQYILEKKGNRIKSTIISKDEKKHVDLELLLKSMAKDIPTMLSIEGEPIDVSQFKSLLGFEKSLRRDDVIKEQLSQFIQKGDLHNLFQFLEERLLDKALLQQKFRFFSTERDFQMGTITYEEYSVMKNRIAQSTISLLKLWD